jgi:hypothetical protein
MDDSVEAAIPCTIVVAPCYLAILHDREVLEKLECIELEHSTCNLRGRFSDDRKVLIGTVVRELMPKLSGVEKLLLARRLDVAELSGGYLPLVHV